MDPSPPLGMTDLGRTWCLGASKSPFWIATPNGEFAQAKTFERYKVRGELVNASDEEARHKIGEEKQKEVEEEGQSRAATGTRFASTRTRSGLPNLTQSKAHDCFMPAARRSLAFSLRLSSGLSSTDQVKIRACIRPHLR